MKVRFLSIAERELSDAFDWYEREQSGLGDSLLEEVDRSIRRIVNFPKSCANMGDGIRRAIINRFPYGLWYGLVQDEIVVYAFGHLHRHPRYWTDRLVDENG